MVTLYSCLFPSGHNRQLYQCWSLPTKRKFRITVDRASGHKIVCFVLGWSSQRCWIRHLQISDQKGILNFLRNVLKMFFQWRSSDLTTRYAVTIGRLGRSNGSWHEDLNHSTLIWLKSKTPFSSVDKEQKHIKKMYRKKTIFVTVVFYGKCRWKNVLSNQAATMTKSNIFFSVKI